MDFPVCSGERSAHCLGEVSPSFLKYQELSLRSSRADSQPTPSDHFAAPAKCRRRRQSSLCLHTSRHVLGTLQSLILIHTQPWPVQGCQPHCMSPMGLGAASRGDREAPVPSIPTALRGTLAGGGYFGRQCPLQLGIIYNLPNVASRGKKTGGGGDTKARSQAGEPNTAMDQPGSCHKPAERARSFPCQSHKETSSCPKRGWPRTCQPGLGGVPVPRHAGQAFLRGWACGAAGGLATSPGRAAPISAGLPGQRRHCHPDGPRQPWMTFIRQR